ncbi:MAG: hypothetical protein SFU85_01965 [Candidatus Methylacidiphilales bacterium]|nr:hypothetical protein [Candidatus Methylacidiphilales bacterium]
MKFLRILAAGSIACTLLGFGVLRAETTLDALELALKKAQQIHDESNKNAEESFSRDITQAVSGSGAAQTFFESCGGKLPAPPDELFAALRKDRDKKEREQISGKFRQDQALTVLDYTELVRFAYLFVSGASNPKKDPAWQAWLESKTKEFADLRSTFLSGSSVQSSPMLRQYGLGGKFRGRKEGEWKLEAIPDLYKEFVVDARMEEKALNPAIAAWDLYLQALEIRTANPGRWGNVEGPRAQFLKFQSLFAINPTQDMLLAMVDILQNHPHHPDFAAMQKKCQEFLAQLKSQRPAG